MRMSEPGLVDVVPMEIEQSPTLEVFDVGAAAPFQHIQAGCGERLSQKILAVFFKPAAGLWIDMALRPGRTLGRDVEITFGSEVGTGLRGHILSFACLMDHRFAVERL
jgi:hypothetical protein